MNFKHLHWDTRPAKNGKPGYTLADITDMFEDIPKFEYITDFQVTIRKYRSVYTIAYWIDLWDEDDPADYDYTNDGEGYGLVPLVMDKRPSVFHIWNRVAHSDFERNFDTYMSMLYRDLEGILSDPL